MQTAINNTPQTATPQQKSKMDEAAAQTPATNDVDTVMGTIQQDVIGNTGLPIDQQTAAANHGDPADGTTN